MLKQLRLHAELKEKRGQLKTLEEKRDDYQARTSELAAALDEAQTDLDIEFVKQQIEALESEAAEVEADEKMKTIKQEIERIEGELKDVEERAAATKKPAQAELRKEGQSMNKLQVRELLKTGAYYERAEVKEFYDRFRNLRAVTGEGLAIPEIVVNRIMDIMGDYTTLYPLVDHVRVNGDVRILIDTDTTPAEWIEQTGTLPEGDVGTITDVSFDGYKIGKVCFIDNAMLQDSIVNLDEYVTKKIARAIALGLDKAILIGTGSADKQPEGIITKLPAENKVEVAPGKLFDIVKPIGLVDTGKDSVGEVVVVVKRQTYYNRLLEYSINTDSEGNTVGKLPNLRTPDLLGLRVVYNQYMPEDAILYGDFSKYTLVERESIVIDKSEHVKFAEDKTGFRGKGRFDGKPTRQNAFVLVTLKEAAPAGV